MLSYVNVNTRDINLGYVTRDEMLLAGFPGSLLAAIAACTYTLESFETAESFPAVAFYNLHILDKARHTERLLRAPYGPQRDDMVTIGTARFSLLDALCWVLDWYKDKGYVETVEVIVNGQKNYYLSVTQSFRDRKHTNIHIDQMIAADLKRALMDALLRCQQDLDCDANYSVAEELTTEALVL